MPTVRASGVELYYEDTGRGTPIVWSHEFGGDLRSWEPQVRHFARRHRVVTYNHRGYPPSEVPKAAADLAVTKVMSRPAGRTLPGNGTVKKFEIPARPSGAPVWIFSL